jgi:hypothetical protein
MKKRLDLCIESLKLRLWWIVIPLLVIGMCSALREEIPEGYVDS